MTILYFIIALGVLVFVHEFGHFYAAKKQGIGVEVFSIGFGPKLISFRRGETLYTVSALPFGGYVKMMGEDPNNPDPDIPPEKAYSKKPIWRRSIVVFAGPFMNLLLAALVMPVIFMIGRIEPVYLDQKPVVVGVRQGSPAEKAGLEKGDEILSISREKDGSEETFADWKSVINYVMLHADETVVFKVSRGGALLDKPVALEKNKETQAGFSGIEPSYFIGNDPVIDEVSPGGPADAGGMRVGDVVLAVNDQPIQTWTDMSDKVGESAGKGLSVTISRDGKTEVLAVTPKYDESLKKWLMGVKKDTSRHSDAYTKKKYGLVEAFKKGTEENLKLCGMTLSVLKRLVSFDLSYKTLGGPIRIAQASAMAAKSGLSDFLFFLCFLSIQLGLLNLLPLPVLDGGHLFFFAVETVTRRPVSVKVRAWAEQAGFVLLISLMLLVTLNDIQSLWDFSGMIAKIRGYF